MSEVCRGDRKIEEIDRIREVVGRHSFPDFVTGFDVRLGDFDGDPAMWIVFRTAGGYPIDPADIEERVAKLQALKRSIRPDLLTGFGERFPFVRFEPDVPEGPGER